MNPKLLALYPRATDESKIANNHFYVGSESNDVNTYDLKGDHNISDRSRCPAATAAAIATGTSPARCPCPPMALWPPPP